MRKRVGATLAIFLILFFFSLCFAGSQDKGGQSTGADLITMDSMSPHGAPARPWVQFPHGKHVARAGETGCLLCHEPRSGQGEGISFSFKQTRGLAGPQAMDRYHSGCLGCHADVAAATGPTGPQVCGGCHVRGAAALAPSSHDVDFSASLHCIHTEDVALDCGTCHGLPHGDDRPVPLEGKGLSAFSGNASHDLCLTCHITDRNTGKESGPLTCNACHGPAAQPSSRTCSPENVPHGGEVSFDHELHASADISCEACHHKAPETACSECHTDGHSIKGGGVSLYAAMHTRNTDRSCIGCHDAMGAGEVHDCTGCHAPFRDGRP